MTADTALPPFDPSLKTIMVADAGPVDIAASVFQAEEPTTWIPTYHARCSLTLCEELYAQSEKEYLVQSWGINTHCYYLLGIPYTDNQSLPPIYNATCKPGPARVKIYHLKIQDFQYTMKYIPGKSNSSNYTSLHPIPLSAYTTSEIADMVIDLGDEMGINKIITDDLPDAVMLHTIEQATKQDPICNKLITSIQRAYITDDQH